MIITVTVQDGLLQLSRSLNPDNPDDWLDQIQIQVEGIRRAKATFDAIASKPHPPNTEDPNTEDFPDSPEDSPGR